MVDREQIKDRLRPVYRRYKELRSPLIRRAQSDDRHLRLLLAFALRHDSCCIDVGANKGDVLREIVRCAPDGRHLAFEPIPDLAAELRRRFPAVTVHEVALADERGTSEFVHVTSAPAMSGLRERSYGRPVDLERIQVAVERLDDLVPDDLAPDLIKIDVEGAELGVLRGAMTTITEHRPIVVFEHGAGGADHYGTTPADVHGLLVGEAGLSLFDLDGNGPYTLREFSETSTRPGGRWNWVARP